jgi:hypothetical protein
MNSRIIGILVMVASIMALVLSGYTSYRAREFVECQAEYNEINNQRTRALTGVAEDERAAERRSSDALGAVFSDPALQKPTEDRTAADRQRIADLFDEYLAAERDKLAARAVADAARRQNPPPPPPSQTC